MATPKILLASKSPRRQEILNLAGYTFEIIEISAEEHFPSHLQGAEIVTFLSEYKSTHYIPQNTNEVVVTADTIVWIDGKVLNKPADEREATEMLELLSGRIHTVFTGVTLKTSEKICSFHDATEVEFYPLSSEQIQHYIQNCQPFDKAGSYGIQDWMGLHGVKRIQGCYYNVMGFPIAKFSREIESFLGQ
jgi:septum formation protein